LYPWGTLFDGIENSPYPESDALRVIGALCQGVGAIHEVGYAHRDIKALNVLLKGNPGGGQIEPILMDLGSARPIPVNITSRKDALLEQETAESESTASYRAAELFDMPSECVVDGKVDVWSLGCLLFALCYGHTPFESPREGFMKLLAVSGDVRFPKDSDTGLPPEISESTKDIIKNAITMRPEDRYTLQALMAALEENFPIAGQL